MLTPMDIHNKEFKKVFRGYSEEEVDQFLDEVIESFERLYKENSELKDKITVLNEKVQHYINMEKTLQNTLVLAQNTAEEIVNNAKKKGELIINEAEEQAKKIVEKANQELVKLNIEYEELKKQLQVFRTRFKTLLEAQMESLENAIRDWEVK